MKYIKSLTFFLLFGLISWLIIASAAHPEAEAPLISIETMPLLLLSLLALLAIWQFKFISDNKKDLLWPLAILLLLLNTLFTINSWGQKKYTNATGHEYATFTVIQSPQLGGSSLQPLLSSCEYCVFKTSEDKTYHSSYNKEIQETHVRSSVSYSKINCDEIFEELRRNNWNIFDVVTSKNNLTTIYHLKRIHTFNESVESEHLIPIHENDPTGLANLRNPGDVNFKNLIETIKLTPENFPANEYLTNDPIQPNPSDIDKHILERWTGRIADENIKFELTPNYAGHLHAFVTGCGTNCKLLNFIDLRNGNFLKSMTINFSCGMSENSPFIYEPKHTIDSRLLVVPCISEPDGEGFHYYEYIKGDLIKIKYEEWDTDWNKSR